MFFQQNKLNAWARTKPGFISRAYRFMSDMLERATGSNGYTMRKELNGLMTDVKTALTLAGDDVIKNLPKLLSRPVMVTKSLNENTADTVIVFVDAYTSDGAIIGVVIKPNGSMMSDGKRGPANFISSIHGFSHFNAADENKSTLARTKKQMVFCTSTRN